jgi:hypothetical protein
LQDWQSAALVALLQKRQVLPFTNPYPGHRSHYYSIVVYAQLMHFVAIQVNAAQRLQAEEVEA